MLWEYSTLYKGSVGLPGDLCFHYFTKKCCSEHLCRPLGTVCSLSTDTQRSPIPGMVGGRSVVLEGLDCDCQPDTQEQREDGELWSQGQSVGRAPQVHRVLTFKEQCEMAFDGLWTVEWVQSRGPLVSKERHCQIANGRQDGRPGTCTTSHIPIISKSLYDLQLLRQCHPITTGVS